MDITTAISDIITPITALGFITLTIYYAALLRHNRRLGVVVLLAFNLDFALEYTRVALSQTWGITGLGYGTLAGTATRVLITVTVLVAIYSVFVRRR